MSGKKDTLARSEETAPAVLASEAKRLGVAKTYKQFIGGAFPRSESGRYYKVTAPSGEVLANACRGSRKDFRDAVVAARAALPGWSSASAYLKGQILYRAAEMLEGRAAQFEGELVQMGHTEAAARREVACAIDRLVYYAGWTDKVGQVFSSVNPVSSSHFNFSLVEPTGVVGLLAPDEAPLAGLVTALAPIIAGGNTCVALASGGQPLCAVSFAEVLQASDLPGGVVNLLTGFRDELVTHFASHMDVNAVVCCAPDDAQRREIGELAAGNVKRVTFRNDNWLDPDAQDPYRILDTLEIKTTWHPVGA